MFKLLFTRYLEEKTTLRAEIRRFFILPSHRAKGYGKQLFQKCLKPAILGLKIYIYVGVIN